MSLVILVLLSHEEETDLGIMDHKLDLLFAAGGIEGHSDSPYTPCAEIGEEVLHRVLREDTHVLLHFDSQIEHGIRCHLNYIGEVIPCITLPNTVAEVSVDKSLSVSVFLCLLMHEHRQMVVYTHSIIVLIMQKYCKKVNLPNKS